MRRGTFTGAVIAIALGALALRIAYVLLLGAHPPLGADGTWYSLQAGTIAEGIGYVDPRRYYGFGRAVPTAQFPPLWPAFLAAVYDLGFGTLRAYRIAGGVIGAGSVVMTAFIGRDLVDARVGLVAAAIVAASPLMIAADGSLMAESLFIALVTASVLVAMRVRAAPGIGGFVLLGLLLGLATLTRSDGLLVGIVLIGATAWCVPGAVLRRLGLACVALVMLAATLLPWTVRNRDALGELVAFSSNSGSLLVGANCAPAYEGREIGGWVAACADAASPRGVNEVDRAAAERTAGLDYARDHLARLVVVAPTRVVRGWGLWSPTVLADAEVIESRNRTMQLAAWPASLVMLAFAAAGGVLLVKQRARVAPVFAVIVGATLVLAGSWGNQRFRLVAEPQVAVLAAAAVVAAWSRSTRGGRRRPQKEPVRP